MRQPLGRQRTGLQSGPVLEQRRHAPRLYHPGSAGATKDALVFKKLAKLNKEGGVYEKPNFETVENPIAKMHHEHDTEGERFRRIAELTKNYTPPEDACTTYKVAFSMLKEFEEDLHKHIHLENNILFKKGIELEKELAK